MKKLKYTILILLLICPLFYFFVGIELIGTEDDILYDFFIKKHPTKLFFYQNMVHCGECDFVEYKDLYSEETKTDFKNLCYYRYDLTDIKQCENLFR
jgi:hypothetical protein